MADPKGQEINLVSGRKQALRERQVIYVKVQFVAMVVLAVFVGVVVTLYGMRLVTAKRLALVNEKVANEETAITQLKVVEGKFRILVNKVNLIDRLLKERVTVLAWLTHVVETLPKGLTMEGMSLDNRGQTLTLSVTAESMGVALAYLDQLETEMVDSDWYQKVSIQGITRGEEGAYVLPMVYSL